MEFKIGDQVKHKNDWASEYVGSIIEILSPDRVKIKMNYFIATENSCDLILVKRKSEINESEKKKFQSIWDENEN